MASQTSNCAVDWKSPARKLGPAGVRSLLMLPDQTAASLRFVPGKVGWFDRHWCRIHGD